MENMYDICRSESGTARTTGKEAFRGSESSLSKEVHIAGEESFSEPSNDDDQWRGQDAELQPDFQAGSIHEPEKVQFWKDKLQASEWVTMVLEQGYELPFETFPDKPYEEDNNQTAKTEMAFVRETIQKWEAQGIVQFVHIKPAAVSPLTVASQIMEMGRSKRGFVLMALVSSTHAFRSRRSTSRTCSQRWRSRRTRTGRQCTI
jgi:hypothetical protein